jgi:hypothetical protein
MVPSHLGVNEQGVSRHPCPGVFCKSGKEGTHREGRLQVASLKGRNVAVPGAIRGADGLYREMVEIAGSRGV